MSISLITIYTKNMHYNSENTPVVFFNESTISQNLELNFHINKMNNDNYEIVMKTVVKATDQNKNLIYEIFIEKGGLFSIKDIPEDDLDEVLNINLPSIVFPYLRQEIENISHYSGFAPFHVQPISFYEIYQNKKSKG